MASDLMRNPHNIYRRLVEDAGLFGGAFFGHQMTKDERRKLGRLWVKACKIAVNNGNHRIQFHKGRIVN